MGEGAIPAAPTSAAGTRPDRHPIESSPNNLPHHRSELAIDELRCTGRGVGALRWDGTTGFVAQLARTALGLYQHSCRGRQPPTERQDVSDVLKCHFAKRMRSAVALLVRSIQSCHFLKCLVDGCASCGHPRVQESSHRRDEFRVMVCRWVRTPKGRQYDELYLNPILRACPASRKAHKELSRPPNCRNTRRLPAAPASI
jgi:hypothetical protein